MPTGHFDDISNIYSQKVEPVSEKQAKQSVIDEETELQRIKKGINNYMPQQVLNEGETVGKLDQLDHNDSDMKNTGPEAAEGFSTDHIDPKHDKKRSDEESAHLQNRLSQPVVQEAKKKKKKNGKGKPEWLKKKLGEDGDDGDKEHDCDAVHDGESHSEWEKKQENSAITDSHNINNSTMKEKNKKSTFDRLFEDVMGEEMDNLDIDLNGGDELGGDEFGGDEFGGEDEGLDTITVDLPRDVAEQLHSALGELLGGEEESLGGEDDLESLDNEFGGEEELPESHVDLQAAPDSVSKLAGMNNKVGGHATPSGGSASGDAAGQVDGGKLKAQSDSVSQLTGKSNKVGGKITGGNKYMFKA